MRVISVLRMQDIELEEWRRLPKIGKTHWEHWCSYVAPLGVEPYLQGSGTLPGSESSQDLPHESDEGVMGEGSGSRLRQSLAQLQPLDRRYLWPAK